MTYSPTVVLLIKLLIQSMAGFDNVFVRMTCTISPVFSFDPVQPYRQLHHTECLLDACSSLNPHTQDDYNQSVQPLTLFFTLLDQNKGCCHISAQMSQTFLESSWVLETCNTKVMTCISLEIF